MSCTTWPCGEYFIFIRLRTVTTFFTGRAHRSQRGAADRGAQCGGFEDLTRARELLTTRPAMKIKTFFVGFCADAKH